MAEVKDTLKELEERMNKTVEFMQTDFAAIRAGRANPHVLDRITVDYYGSATPIQQVGNISAPDPRTIMIQPWDKSLLKPIEKAIQKSDIGINPNNDGQVIRLVFPELTEERRKELAKDIKKKGEAAKVAVRNIRRDGADQFKKLEKASEITEDDLDLGNDKLQKLTDKFVKKVDSISADKEKEILEM